MKRVDPFEEAAALRPPPLPTSLLTTFWLWWAHITWWTHQTGRMMVSTILALVIYVLYSVLPAWLALPATALFLIWIGQFDVSVIRAGKKE